MVAVPQERITATLNGEDLAALQQAVSHFDRLQLIWSSGYLAGLAGSTAPVAEPPASLASVRSDSSPQSETWHIFYATETGNGRSVAAQLAARSQRAGLETELHDLRDTRPKLLRNVERAVFVLPTHGIGEPPEGSEAFFEFWMSDKAPKLPKLQYSVLALGDSSYADFCEIGRSFDARLGALGAQAVVARVDCDLDFAEAAASWTERVVGYAEESAAPQVAPRGPRLAAVPAPSAYSQHRPWNATVLARQVITGRGSSKLVQHIELDLEGAGLAYQPGDSLAVVASNPPRIVDALTAATGLDGDTLIDREITALSRPLLDAIAKEHPQLQAILADRGRFLDYLDTRQLIDLVHEFPVDWQQPHFAAALRKLPPRSYSIASSPDANPDEAHLTVAVVDYEKHGRRHWGAASAFLAGDAEQAPVYVAANENFRLPADGDTAIIMVGAGTGVAPYRAFVEHRREHGHPGANWLVYGDRNFSSDFLYQLEWLRYRKEGTLDRLDVAFSRDQAEKIYVQDRLLEFGKDIYAWLQQGAHFYVCGDATHMANDVHAALLAIVAEHGGLQAEAAAGYLAELRQARRYQRDVY